VISGPRAVRGWPRERAAWRERASRARTVARPHAPRARARLGGPLRAGVRRRSDPGVASRV